MKDDIMTCDLGYAFLPSTKLSIVKKEDDQFVFMPLSGFGLEEIPVCVEGKYCKKLFSNNGKLLGYNFYLMDDCNSLITPFSEIDLEDDFLIVYGGLGYKSQWLLDKFKNTISFSSSGVVSDFVKRNSECLEKIYSFCSKQKGISKIR